MIDQSLLCSARSTHSRLPTHLFTGFSLSRFLNCRLLSHANPARLSDDKHLFCLNICQPSHQPRLIVTQKTYMTCICCLCHFNTFPKIFRLTPVSVRNKAGLNVCLPFHASTKSFSELNKIWYGYTVCCMTRFKVRVTEVPKLRKWPISKSISSAGMHVINRLMVNYTPIQLSKFYPYRCSSLFGPRDLHTKDVSPLAIL